MTTQTRKSDHLKISFEKPVQFRSKTTGFECVELLHQAVPEIGLEKIDLSTKFLGKKMSAPVIIAGMTGGTEEGGMINRNLAKAAQKFGIGMGVGSQRAMIEDPKLAETFKVRDAAPDILLLGNLGLVQFCNGYGLDEAKRAVEVIGADGLCIHLNAAQEIAQPEGDTNFSNGLKKIKDLCKLKFPIVAKECGAGISRNVAKRLVNAKVKAIDVGGAGGTSWVGVEYYRYERKLAKTFWDWGIPTAASVKYCSGLGVQVIATGGIRTGLDAAKAFALGADFVGVGLPLLLATKSNEIETFLQDFIDELKATMFLTGCKNIRELRKAKKVVFEPLKTWIST